MSESLPEIEYNCMDDRPIRPFGEKGPPKEPDTRYHKKCPLCYWVGVVVREYRERADLTQEDLALKCDLSMPGVAFIERNARRPSLWALRRICRALGISVGQVIVEAEMRSLQAGDDSIPLFA